MDNDAPPALDAVVDLGPLPGLTGYALRRAQIAVFHDFHRTMEAEGIRTAQFSVLEVLKANPGLRQTQVSFALGIKTTNFVPLFDELERRGLAERRPIPGDRRAKGLFLTEAGRATLERLEKLVAEHEARFVARIGAAGKAQLLGLLHRLTDRTFDPDRS
ncbi:MarR family transcriptional regulator [Rhodovastum sp. RN2-1]|uniref:MarR family transcriptional regulator n=2 Tax=Limobrevibacterium gyesilva TaxID=2991712 RepID=A0AA41YVM1_9PROT|nr:MarR family transcriptional regulator [Limobrevibacterium gyesilva]